MAKFYGPVAYATTYETSEGIWTEEINERMYYGDVNRNTRKLISSDKINNDVDISNEISIVADPYAMENFHNIRYVGYMGSKWKVNSVDVQFPRLILSIGGVYND